MEERVSLSRFSSAEMRPVMESETDVVFGSE